MNAIKIKFSKRNEKDILFYIKECNFEKKKKIINEWSFLVVNESLKICSTSFRYTTGICLFYLFIYLFNFFGDLK